MTTTITITVTEHRGPLGPVPPKTEVTVTRASKTGAIAAAITMLAAAHRPEVMQEWAAVRAQVEPLLEAYRQATRAEDQPAPADARGGTG